VPNALRANRAYATRLGQRHHTIILYVVCLPAFVFWGRGACPSVRVTGADVCASGGLGALGKLPRGGRRRRGVHDDWHSSDDSTSSDGGGSEDADDGIATPPPPAAPVSKTSESGAGGKPVGGFLTDHDEVRRRPRSSELGHGRINDLAQVNPDLKCGFCDKLIVRPGFLPCGHFFCFMCLLAASELPEGLHCPTCDSGKVRGAEGFCVGGCVIETAQVKISKIDSEERPLLEEALWQEAIAIGKEEAYARAATKAEREEASDEEDGTEADNEFDEDGDHWDCYTSEEDEMERLLKAQEAVLPSDRGWGGMT
jgi:hypothetical protein